MRFDDIAETTTELAEDVCIDMFHELLLKDRWRCYSNTTFGSEIEQLADTFLRLHGTGYIFDDQTPVRTQDPPLIIAWQEPRLAWVHSKVVIYANGAVAVQYNTDEGTRNILLFLSEETAAKYNYPDEGYLYAYKAIAEAVKKELGNAVDGDEHG